MSNFEQCTDAYEREGGGERWIRRIDPECWISVLHRMTGFGFMEWETALVFVLPVEGRERTWKDRNCLIIAGDRRAELETMPKEQLRDWYAVNIDGNRNTFETVIELLRKGAT